MSVFHNNLLVIAAATPIAVCSFVQADAIDITTVSNSIDALAYLDPFNTDADATGDVGNNPWSGSANAELSNSSGAVQAMGTGNTSWNGNSFQSSYTNNTSVSNDIKEEFNADAKSTVSAVFTALETTSYQLTIAITALNYIVSLDQVSGNFSLQSTGAILHEWSGSQAAGSTTFTFTGSITAGDSFVLTTSASSLLNSSGTDAFAGNSTSTGVASFDLSFVAGTVIPLPAAGFMGLAGLGGLMISRRRR
jgi:hypothetical protein